MHSMQPGWASPFPRGTHGQQQQRPPSPRPPSSSSPCPRQGPLRAGSRRAFQGCRDQPCCCSCSCGCGRRWPHGPGGRSGSGTCGAQLGYNNGNPSTSPTAPGSCATTKLGSGPSSRLGNAGMPHGAALNSKELFFPFLHSSRSQVKTFTPGVRPVMSKAGAVWALLGNIWNGDSLERRQNPTGLYEKG